MEPQTYQIEDAVGAQHWWFAGRRAILETVLRAWGVKPTDKLYDLGCGTGQNLVMLQTLADATGVDMSDEALGFARGRGCRSTLQGSLYDLPIAEGSADVVVATDIVEHLEDDARGVSEILRVLKPGGFALLTVPAFMWLWGTQDDVSHHHRRYDRAQFEQLLKGAGFTIEKLTFYNFLLFAPIFAGRLAIRLSGKQTVNENHLSPTAMNGVLRAIFATEGRWLKVSGFPVGVSLIAIVRKPS